MKKDLKAKFRKGLSAQFNENKAQKDSASSSTGANNHVFDTKAIGNRKMISFKDGDQLLIRFVPYEVDETHPLVKKGKIDADDSAYMLGFDMHVVGEDNASYLCPRTFGHKCPICEKSSALYNEGDTEASRPLRAKRRVLYNIVVLKNYKRDDTTKYDMNEVYLLHESQYLFEKGMLDELQKGGDDEDDDTMDNVGYDIVNFCVGAVEPEEALALKVMCTGKKMEKKLSFKVVSHRDSWDALDEDNALEQALPLHKLLNVMSYEELEHTILGAVTSDDEDDDEDDEEERATIRKAKKSRKPVQEEEDDEDDDDDEEEEEKPVRKSKKSGRSTDEEDEEDSTAHPTSDSDTEDEDESESDDEKPVRKIGVTLDEYEEKRAAEKKAKKEDTPECPSGFNFAKDFMEYEECDNCDLYDECRAMHRALRRK